MDNGALHQPKGQHDDQRGRPAIAEQGQGNPHHGRHAHHHRQVDGEIQKEVHRDADDQKLAEAEKQIADGVPLLDGEEVFKKLRTKYARA